MTNLSVNINKIATLRNARGGNMPNVVQAAIDCQRFGADGIILTGSGENSTSTTYGDANYVYSVVDEEKVVKGKAIVVIQE